MRVVSCLCIVIPRKLSQSPRMGSCVCSYLAFIKEVNGNVLLPQLFYNSAIVPGSEPKILLMLASGASLNGSSRLQFVFSFT